MIKIVLVNLIWLILLEVVNDGTRLGSGHQKQYDYGGAIPVKLYAFSLNPFQLAQLLNI